MINRLLVSIGAVFFLLAASLPGQAPASSTFPRTPDGHPDLQGTWNATTLTPLERPAEFAHKATVSDKEARAYENKDHQSDTDQGASPSEAAFNKAEKAVGGRDSQFWDESPQLARVNGLKRTSLIVDPTNGKIPPRTPEGEKRMAANFVSFNRYGGVKERPVSERCLPDYEIPILPVGVNDNYQIVQTPGAVMMVSEMIHDVRIIRMNASHVDANVRLWLGDSIGRWEGDALVVDTTNFNNQLTSGATSEKLHIVERFSRVDANTLLYKATIDDPATFAKQWTVEYPFAATPKPLYEYACHEGNSSLGAILAGAK